MQRINEFLDKHVFVWPVAFLTNRLVILFTMLLLVPLVIYANHTVFVLTSNSYLNTMGVAVSSIVLLFTTIESVKAKKTAEAHEKRAQEDHAHMVEIHNFLLRFIIFQHDQMEDLKQKLAAAEPMEYEPQPLPEDLRIDDLKLLHARGADRFAEGDHLVVLSGVGK